jgi:hypothetical protein
MCPWLSTEAQNESENVSSKELIYSHRVPFFSAPKKVSEAKKLKKKTF